MQRLGNLGHYNRRLVRRQLSDLQKIIEWNAPNEICDDGWQALNANDLVNSSYARMPQLGSRSCFSLKSLQQMR
jgi:hypothetical protein